MAADPLIVSKLLDEWLIPAINAAWPGIKYIDEDDMPRTIEGLPFVHLSWLAVDANFGGVNAAFGSMNQAYDFSITYRDKIPQGKGVLPAKVSRLREAAANALIPFVQNAPNVPGLGNLPSIKSVNSVNSGDPRYEGLYGIQVVVCIQAQARHH